MTIHDIIREAGSNYKETARAFFIGPQPWADGAYLHRIHKPAEPNVRVELSRTLGFPASLDKHFEYCNGGVLFSASPICLGINLLGCVPAGLRHNRSEFDQPPSDIRLLNLQPRDYVAIAYYGADLSLVLVSRRDETVRCCYGKDAGTVRCEWDSIETWLSSEIDRISSLFRSDGSCLVPCDDLLPPAQSSKLVDPALADSDPPRTEQGLSSAFPVPIPPDYRRLRGDRIWPHAGITVYPLTEIAARQVGYGYSPDGQSLVGPRGWQRDWLVIGHEDLCGDPIFLNVAEPALPVFTSAHGEDSWEPDLISRSAEVFFESMDLLEKAQNGILSAAAVLSKISEMHSCEDARREEPDIEFWSVPLESPES